MSCFHGFEQVSQIGRSVWVCAGQRYRGQPIGSSSIHRDYFVAGQLNSIPNPCWISGLYSELRMLSNRVGDFQLDKLYNPQWFVLPLIIIILCSIGCLDPIVGAKCRPGLHLCDGKCITLDTFENCGICGNFCGPFMCVDGRCDWTKWRADAGMWDATIPTSRKDAQLDSGIVDAADSGPIEVLDTSLPQDVGLPNSCRIGEMKCGDECVQSSIDHCGSCNNKCGDDEVCSAGQCLGECEDLLTRCGTLCVDTNWDPNNCGRCGHVCASGICAAGQCADATAGHLVIIGHNYINSNYVMRRIAGNAVFLAVGSPINVLVFEGDALESSINGVDSAIDFVASRDGRTWDRISAIEGLVTWQLSMADVLLIYAQQNASNSELEKYGESWGVALNGFLRQGGIVVLFDGEGENHGTFQILQPSQLFLSTGIDRVTGNAPLEVVDLSDQIAVGIPKMYSPRGDTVGFETISSPANPVVETESGLPVIIHRVIY